MTWLLSDARAVPMNYNALELNEARINWFNASSNYNDVVTAAANDAGGQGFVTEFAGRVDHAGGRSSGPTSKSRSGSTSAARQYWKL